MTFYVSSFCAHNEEKCLFIYERVNYISISSIVFDDSPLPVSSSIFDNAVLLLFHFSIYNACTGCGIGGRGGICAFEKYGEIECVMILETKKNFESLQTRIFDQIFERHQYFDDDEGW